jgi:hypothetical protein
MAKFLIGRPVTTDVPEVLVDAGLPDGQHRFRLEVVDSAGNRSRPDEIVLSISRVVLPTGPVLGTGTLGPVLGTGPLGPVRPPVLQPPAPLPPVRPPLPQPILPVRPPRGRNRSDP